MDSFDNLRRKIKRWSNREELLAVDNQQLRSLLDSAGIREDLEAGEIDCAICGKPVSTSSVAALGRLGDSVAICCDRPTCLLEFPHHLKGGRR